MKEKKQISKKQLLYALGLASLGIVAIIFQLRWLVPFLIVAIIWEVRSI